MEGDIKSLNQDLDQGTKDLINFVIKLPVVVIIIPQVIIIMIRKLLKKIRAKIGTPKWYQSYTSCLFHRHQLSKIIPEDEELTNYEWYVETQLVRPARDTLSGLTNG